MYKGYQKLQELKSQYSTSEKGKATYKPVVFKTSGSDIPVEKCICGSGKEYGHRNQAGGYCCPHYGNTCGFHQEYNH